MNKNDHSFTYGGAGLAVIILLAAGFTYIPGCLDRQEALKLCRQSCGSILREAKIEKPEIGSYEATLDVTDPWGNNLHSALGVAELSNTVLVASAGKDGEIGTDDDIAAKDTDVHIRKTLAKGIQSGAHSAGKGLTSGVIEGLGEASDAAVTKAKAGFTKTKSKFMSRFKKKDKEQKETDSEGD